MRTPCQAFKGFTLIELLIVIVIIAVLAGLGFGVYFKVQDSARGKKTSAFLAQVMTALQAYNTDYHAMPEFQGTWEDGTASMASTNAKHLYQQLSVDNSYLEVAEGKGVSADGELIDTWGVPLIYLAWDGYETVSRTDYKGDAINMDKPHWPDNAPNPISGSVAGAEVYSAGQDGKFGNLRDTPEDADNIVPSGME